MDRGCTQSHGHQPGSSPSGWAREALPLPEQAAAPRLQPGGLRSHHGRTQPLSHRQQHRHREWKDSGQGVEEETCSGGKGEA